MTKNCTKKFNALCYTNVHADRATSLSAMDFYTMTNEVRVIKGNVMKKMT